MHDSCLLSPLDFREIRGVVVSGLAVGESLKMSKLFKCGIMKWLAHLSSTTQKYRFPTTRAQSNQQNFSVMKKFLINSKNFEPNIFHKRQKHCLVDVLNWLVNYIT
jgi:hypothetical protein